MIGKFSVALGLVVATLLVEALPYQTDKVTVALAIPYNADALLSKSYTVEELWCVARTVYGEARGESDYGKRLVALTIINRSVKKGVSFCNIVNAPGQFAGAEAYPSFYSIKNKKEYVNCLEISKATIENYTDASSDEKAIYYFHSRVDNPSWASPSTLTFHEGGHKFYSGPFG